MVYNQTHKHVLDNGFPTMTRYGTTFASVPLERNTLGSTRTSCNPATHDRPLISLECIECISPTVGISNRFPNGTTSTIDFLEVNETLDQVIIHPNRCDLHSHAACPISVIYRMMRLEATLYHRTKFTLNATSSNPSNHQLTSTTIHYVLAKRSFLLRFHSWYG